MEKLKELRLANGLSQTEIAFELGISQKAYSKIENGYVKLTHEKIKKLSEFYKVTPDFLCSLSCCCINDNDINDYLVINNKISIDKIETQKNGCYTTFLYHLFCMYCPAIRKKYLLFNMISCFIINALTIFN